MAVGIQRHDVFEAADALIQVGLRPTIERVRQKLGRGSPNTVSPLLDDWFQTLGPRLAGTTGPTNGTPPGPVELLASKFWEAALAEARKELLPLQEMLERERDQLDSQKQAHTAQVFELETKLQQSCRDLAQSQLHLAGSHEKEAACQAMAATLAQEVRTSHAATQEVQRSLEALRLSTATEKAQLIQQHAATGKHWAMEVARARQALITQQEQSAQVLDKLSQELEATQVRESAANAALLISRGDLQAQVGLMGELKASRTAWQALATKKELQGSASVRAKRLARSLPIKIRVDTHI